MRSPADPLTTFFYLVTAKHVAMPLVSGGEWFVRFNTSAGSAEVRADDRVKWWTHPDPQQSPSVDAAVTPSFLPPSAQFAPIPLHTFLTAGTRALASGAIGPGSEAFITGLFTKMTGRAKNIPLMRMATIAMMPDEKIPNIKIGDYVGESEVYLLEARSLGGLSGSPVWAMTTATIPITDKNTGEKAQLAGFGQFFFLGLMNGHWLIRERESNDVEIESVREEEGSIATGISVVVPAHKILEVLRHPELEAMRYGHHAARLAAGGTTTSN